MSWRILFVRAFFVCGFFLLFSVPASAQTVGSFSTTWKTDNPGTTASNQIRIPTTGAGYNYNIYWENVSSSTINGTLLGRTGATTITFPAPGTYRVDISGTFPRIYFNNGGDRQKILTINQWGSITWTSMANAFAGATNLQSTASDSPNLAAASSTAYMFADTAFNQDISGWNVSTITNMSGMFSGATSFNQSLSGWDVSNVTTFDYLFYGATPFNQSLADWDVSPTATFNAIFNDSAFNQDFTTWTWLYNPARTSWEGLLEGANAFTVDISNLVIPANITNLAAFFRRNDTFNQNISSWDVSNVTEMYLMFSEATTFNQPLNSWDVSQVTSMSNMFDGMLAFNQPLNNWDVSNVTDMSCMFCYSTAFNQDISNWDVSSVTSMSTMFYENPTFNQPLDDWVTTSLTDFAYMFENATAFDQDISNFDVSNVTNAYNVLRESALSTSNYSKILNSWAAQTVQSGLNLTIIGDSGSPTPYCSTAQAARDILTGTRSWSFTDGGSTPCFTLTYTAGLNALIVGFGTQLIIGGEDGTSVEVVPDEGYQFVRWSDGSTVNPRVDLAIGGDLAVSAIIEPVSDSGGSSATRIGDRLARIDTLTSTTTKTETTYDTFIASVSDLLAYLKDNEAVIDSLTTEEKDAVITALIKIVTFLMGLLTEMTAKTL